MRVSLLFSRLVVVLLAIFMTACGGKPQNVSISNESGITLSKTTMRAVPNGEPGQNEFYTAETKIYWDVDVTLNGVACGVV